jgi:TRAP-type C4-dicarboxylate transport system permease small subunit
VPRYAQRTATVAAKVVDRVEFAFLLVGIVSLFAMMLLIAVNTMMRYLFSDPITGMYEVVELYLMMAVFYFALPYVEAREANVRADIISRRFSSTVSRRIEIVSLAVTLVVAGWITILVYQRAMSFVDRLITTSGVIEFPVYVSWFIVVVGLAMLLARLLVKLGATLHAEYRSIQGAADE